MVNTEQSFLREISRHPTKDYIYPGAYEMLETLLTDGHSVIVWTNEYFKNVASSRLGKLRRLLPASEKKRFSVVTATESEDKHAVLPMLFNQAGIHGFSSIIIIDNTREKLEKASEIIENREVRDKLPYQLIWVTDDLPFAAVSPCSLSPEIPLVSIPTLNHITKFEFSENTLFLIDFNDTIIDTNKWENDALHMMLQT